MAFVSLGRVVPIILVIVASNTAASQTPAERLRTLFDQRWENSLRESPLLATNMGDRRFNDRLPEVGLAAERRRTDSTRAFLARLRAIPRDSLTRAEQINRDIAERGMKESLEFSELGGFLIPITNREGFHTGFPELHQRTPLRTTEDYRNYTARLAAFRRYTAGYIELMREGLRKGMTLPSVSLDGIEDTITPHIVTDPTKSLLWKPFAEFPATVPAADRAALAAAGRAAITSGVAAGYQDIPGKMELAVELTQWTFPYLLFISLVALLSGVLNSLTRFAIAAFAPALLNLALILALVFSPGGGPETVQAMALAVIAGGLLQLAICWESARRAGVRLRFFTRPRMSPAVKELVVLVLPATFAAGVYQISQFFYGFFASRLGEGAMAYLNYADRLNQLPLSIIGTALGTAILPAISRAIDRGREDEASRVQGRALELAMLLTLPAALALGVAAGPIIGALFEGGRFTVEDARITGNILAILVTGLPGYVLVKVLAPGFYARKDVRTPVRIAMAVLLGSVAANFLLIPWIGIYSLATVTAAGAWINYLALHILLHRRGHFRVAAPITARLLRQLVAAAAMAGLIWMLRIPLADFFLGSAIERIFAIGLLVGVGAAAYFGIAWAIGGVNRDDLSDLMSRRASQ